MSGRWQKLRGRSLAEVRERLGQAVRKRLEYVGIAGDVREPTDEELRRALRDSWRADEFGAHVMRRTSPPFFASVRDGSAAAVLRTAAWAAERTALLRAAEKILVGHYDLLGYTNLQFGDPIEWHFDPVHAVPAPRVHWSRVPYLDARRAGDHKIIWELNRHQHFMVLGRAYQVTGEAVHAECFAAQVRSWMDANPPKTGVNWASSLEVAYRSIAWLWALELFRGAAALTPSLVARMVKYLVVSGRHLEHNLSTYFSPNTHLTGEALGLLYIGTMLPELVRADTWRALGWGILEREITRQIHPDGVYFEQASYYHRYTVDIFVHAALVADLGGTSPSSVFRERLGAATEHLGSLMRSDGSMPFFGDDDGGRLVLLETRDKADVRSSVIAGSLATHQAVPATCGGEFRSEEALWLFGAAAVNHLDVEPAADARSRVYADGGYVVMRSGAGANELHAVFDRGPLGVMNCGHAHADALALVVSVGGCPILVDAGTYTYTVSSDDRRHFRHSAAHNTVTVDGESSSSPGGPFTWETRADVTPEEDTVGALVEVYSGSTPGFLRLVDPVRHRRTVIFVRGAYWLIRDQIEALGEHTMTAHFHLAPGTRITSRNERAMDLEVPCAAGDRQVVFSVAGDVHDLRSADDWVSPVYGSRLLAPRIRVTSIGRGPRELITLIAPVSESLVTLREERSATGRIVLVDGREEQDEFSFDQESLAGEGGIEVAPGVAFARRRKSGTRNG